MRMSDPAGSFWEAIRSGDVDGAMGIVAEDATIDLLPANVKGGKGEARAFFDATVTAFPDLLLTVKNHFIGTDGTAVTEMKMEGTQAADYLGVVNQEKHIDLDQVWMLGVSNGEVTSIRGFWDQNILYRRLAVKRLDAVAIV